MELNEAIEILKSNHNPIVAERCQKCEQQDACLDENKYFLAIETVLQEIEQREIDLTTVHIKGVCDEKQRWRNEIKKKIQQIKIDEKTRMKASRCSDRCLIKLECESKENVLRELLKGE